MKDSTKNRFRSQYDYDPDSVNYELNTLPSDTIPDQSLSIYQLLDGYSSGTLPAVKMFDDYDDDDYNFMEEDLILDGVGDLTDRDLINKNYEKISKDIDSHNKMAKKIREIDKKDTPE